MSKENESIAIKLPYYFEKQQDISQILTREVERKMEEKQDHIEVGNDKLVTISRKNLYRSMYLTKVRKYRHKETGEIVEKVESSIPIRKSYEYSRMPDFYENNPQEPYTIIDFKQILSKKVIEGKSIDDVSFNIFPHSFLKPHSLAPPTADMVTNRKRYESKAHATSKYILFGDPVPEKHEVDIPEYVASSKIFPIVKEYFERRPCWLRNVLEYTLHQKGLKGQFTKNQIKNVLKFLAYTYRDGPWKHTFCRFGYDPSKNVEAVGYQIALVKIKKKEVEDYVDKSEESDDVYDPTLSELPTGYNKLYQLYDIRHPEVQEILQIASNSATNCSKDFGWLNKTEHQTVQRAIREVRDGLRN